MLLFFCVFSGLFCRWVVEHIFPARSISHVLNFSGVGVAALVGAGWADIRVKGGSSVRISLEAAHIYCIILQICSVENDSTQSPQTPTSKAALHDAIHNSGLLPSAVDAALKELQVASSCIRVLPLNLLSRLYLGRRTACFHDTSPAVSVTKHGPFYLLQPFPAQSPPAATDCLLFNGCFLSCTRITCWTKLGQPAHAAWKWESPRPYSRRVLWTWSAAGLLSVCAAGYRCWRPTSTAARCTAAAKTATRRPCWPDSCTHRATRVPSHLASRTS